MKHCCCAEPLCPHTVRSDRQKRQAEVGDGRRPVQHPAAEEEETGEEGSRSQEKTTRTRDRGEITTSNSLS